MNRKIKAAACAAVLTIAGAVAVPAHAMDGSDGRFGIGKGRYDHFKPDPKRTELRCMGWPGDVSLVPPRLVGHRVDTVVGHDTFRVRRCDGYTQMKGSSFVISLNDGWVGIS